MRDQLTPDNEFVDDEETGQILINPDDEGSDE